MQDKLIEAAQHVVDEMERGYPVLGPVCRLKEALAAVRAHDAGTSPTAAVNYAAIDRGWRMLCQSCGTDAPCPETAKYVVAPNDGPEQRRRRERPAT